MQYSLSDNLTPAKFEELRLSGNINSKATYEDYLELRRERVIMKREAKEAARRDGYKLGAPELELMRGNEAIVDQAWAEMAAGEIGCE